MGTPLATAGQRLLLRRRVARPARARAAAAMQRRPAAALRCRLSQLPGPPPTPPLRCTTTERHLGESTHSAAAVRWLEKAQAPGSSEPGQSKSPGATPWAGNATKPLMLAGAKRTGKPAWSRPGGAADCLPERSAWGAGQRRLRPGRVPRRAAPGPPLRQAPPDSRRPPLSTTWGRSVQLVLSSKQPWYARGSALASGQPSCKGRQPTQARR